MSGNVPQKKQENHFLIFLKGLTSHILSIVLLSQYLLHLQKKANKRILTPIRGYKPFCFRWNNE
jgi:hypothetical protein